MTTKQFCVMTVGRSGSTALMYYLQKFDDIALPCKDIDCADNELLHPLYVEQYRTAYAALSGNAAGDNEALVSDFFNLHAQAAYAGFKSMPDRHPDIEQFLARTDIQIIALWREDVASTVASFIKAVETGTWRRDGSSEADSKWRFDPARHQEAVLKNLLYVLVSNALLKNAPNAIKLSYEQLCQPDFSHPQLDKYFQREIRIDNPKPPTSAEQYVENWAEFKRYIDEATKQIIKTSRRETAKPMVAQDSVRPGNKSVKNEVQELSTIMPELAGVFNYLEKLSAVAQQREADFAEIQSLCLFIGYPRSGHSIIGALLDAHPDICIAQELDITRCINAGMQRNVIYHLLTENSRIFTEQGKQWNTYNYRVPGQWQGRTRKLKVIGDKKGGGLSRALIQDPSMLDRLHSTFRLPIKFIHITRNPYDNVATLAAKQNMSLDQAAALYFAMAKAALQLKARLRDDAICEISHEAFIADPQGILDRLVNFLGLTASPDYLQACAAIVSKKPHESRHEANWSDAQKVKMANSIRKFPFFEHYQFESV